MTNTKNNFFTPADNTKPYFKAALQGFAGSGKTYTGAQIAIGLHKRIKSEKPVVIFDTEKAAKFLKPLFKKAKIKLLVKKSRSLADLKEAMRIMREGFADILIIDSISHVWENTLEAYKKKTGHTFLQFQDWGIIKPTWKKEFSDPFVNDPYHIIMCGRAGYEYENEVNPDTHKREIYKSGIKMKVEGETAYEPDLLLLMERFEKTIGEEKEVWREATVLKDRSTLLDGQTFKNPTYANFEPTIEAMMANPVKGKQTIEGKTEELFKTEEEKAEWRKKKDITLEKIQSVLSKAFPGMSAEMKQKKQEVCEKAFKVKDLSWTEIEGMSLKDLEKGYESLQKEIEKVVKEGKKEIEKIKGEKLHKPYKSKLSPKLCEQKIQDTSKM